MVRRPQGSALAILAPGSSGSTGIDAIKRIRASHPDAHIVASDRDPAAVGFHLADSHFVTQPFDAPGAFEAALEALQRRGVRIILPTCRSDTAGYAGAPSAVQAVGATFVGSDGVVVELCDDKAAFKRAIDGHFLQAEPIAIDEDGPRDYPCFVKPRRGSGGQGAMLCRSQADWRSHRDRFPQALIAEQYIPGEEYSVDVLSDLESVPLVAVARARMRVWEGVSTHIKVIRDEALETLAKSLASFLGLKGPSCLQFRRGHDKRLYVQEVNARLGGASIASALAGVDMVDLSIRLGLGQPLTLLPPKAVTVLRYLTEITI